MCDILLILCVIDVWCYDYRYGWLCNISCELAVQHYKPVYISMDVCGGVWCCSDWFCNSRSLADNSIYHLYLTHSCTTYICHRYVLLYYHIIHWSEDVGLAKRLPDIQEVLICCIIYAISANSVCYFWSSQFHPILCIDWIIIIFIIIKSMILCMFNRAC